MEKPIFAISVKDVIINGKAWEDAHYLWYEEQEEKLKSKSLNTEPIEKWKKLLKENPEEEKKTYFKFVDEIMTLLYPNFSEQEKTHLARESYFDSVMKYILKNPETVNNDFLEYLEEIKDKYKIAIITTNTYSSLEKILNITGINKELFDFIETSKAEEKDNKTKVFERFLEKHEKPKIYLSANPESVNYWKQKGVNSILTDFYFNSGLPDCVVNVEELRERV